MSKPQAKRRYKTQLSFVAQPKLRRLLARGLLVGFVAAIMIGIAYKIEDLSFQSYLRDQKLETTVKVIEIREKIEADVFHRILDLNELATVLGQNPDMSPTEFNLKAVDFLMAYPEVKNIAAAPDLFVEMVFPLRGNEAIIGLDYRQNEEQFAGVEEAIRTGEGIITGPVDLVQGGRGLIMRKPVFTRTPTGIKKPWGILSVVLDYDKFMERIGIPEFEKEFDILIRNVGTHNSMPAEVLLGSPAILNQNPIELAFNFPFGNWQFAATPNGGWPVHRPGHVAGWFQRGLLITFCLITLWYVMSLLDRRRLAEKLLSTGIEAIDHGFVMFDSNRRLVAFNKKYKQLAGGSGMVRIGALYEDIVKANLDAGLIPDAVGREEEWYAEWSQRLDIKEADKEQILADGRTIRAYDRPMEDGSVVGLRIDISDLKKAQIAAEAANKAKTDFMGVLSHELRTPLTVILGHAQLAKNFRSMPAYKKLLAEIETHPELTQEVEPKLDAMSDQIGKMMEAIERSGNHLFTLISEILDFAKIDSGTLSMDMEPATACDIVEPVVEQMRPMVVHKGLRLDAQCAPLDLVGDSKRLQQVLINLIGNASKFTDNGTISVEVAQEGDDILFKVQDTGIGIPKEHLSRVFEAFHQVDSTSGRKYGGTGLGLAISRDIARAHGGDMSASSIEGQGSTFTLRIPRAEAVAKPQEAEEHEIEALVA
ncbi:ATPase [Sulfitobacter sp. JBTF-M27]|uniref:histidine kinase n=1 Tax=Sulfitobacter sediminilitoris TaxID=2698830 RepID=A0A6P0C6S3_9RHOB|nr:ATP-binding protein [Sulfitobacter sediminilitoris]NEK20808.1 ATPase [Sulfitobacter sediminilitoris]